ncbi:MAG: hypothetical protein JKY96_02445 [Phycisphaerales bacterium]|nr:hypothetical protein [Phycisphaerales bacterium]
MAGSPAPYDIIRTQDICAHSGDPLAVGDEHIAVLLEREGEDSLVRSLYSIKAWEEGVRPQAPDRLFGFWKRIIPDKEDRVQPLVNDDEMMDLFEQLEQATESKQIAFRYLLGLILMRKKRLIFEGSTPASDDAPPTLSLRMRIKGGGGPIFRVIDPQLDDQAITDATEELGRVMNLDSADES